MDGGNLEEDSTTADDRGNLGGGNSGDSSSSDMPLLHLNSPAPPSTPIANRRKKKLTKTRQTNQMPKIKEEDKTISIFAGNITSLSLSLIHI